MSAVLMQQTRAVPAIAVTTRVPESLGSPVEIQEVVAVPEPKRNRPLMVPPFPTKVQAKKFQNLTPAERKVVAESERNDGTSSTAKTMRTPQRSSSKARRMSSLIESPPPERSPTRTVDEGDNKRRNRNSENVRRPGGARSRVPNKPPVLPLPMVSRLNAGLPDVPQDEFPVSPSTTFRASIPVLDGTAYAPSWDRQALPTGVSAMSRFSLNTSNAH